MKVVCLIATTENWDIYITTATTTVHLMMQALYAEHLTRRSVSNVPVLKAITLVPRCFNHWPGP